MTRRRFGLLLCVALWLPVHAADVRDDLGVAVQLSAPAKRILTLSPHATELAIAAGLGDRLVAISRGGGIPDGYAGLPRIGGAGPLDRERLLALQPDLVIAWASGNRAQDLAWMTRIGIPVYRSEPTSLEQIAVSIVALGALGDTEATAQRRAADFARATQSACSGLPLVPVYVVVWERPAMTVGGRHWLNDVLQAAGWRNRFADQPRGVFAVADEVRLASANLPEISLLRRYDRSEADRLADQLSRPGPRLGDAVQSLCRLRLALP